MLSPSLSPIRDRGSTRVATVDYTFEVIALYTIGGERSSIAIGCGGGAISADVTSSSSIEAFGDIGYRSIVSSGGVVRRGSIAYSVGVASTSTIEAFGDIAYSDLSSSSKIDALIANI